MSPLSAEVWVLLGIVGGAAAVAMLHTLAVTFGRERELHDLKGRVRELRKAYTARLVAMGQDEVVVAEVVEDLPEETAMSEAA